MAKPVRYLIQAGAIQSFLLELRPVIRPEQRKAKDVGGLGDVEPVRSAPNGSRWIGSSGATVMSLSGAKWMA